MDELCRVCGCVWEREWERNSTDATSITALCSGGGRFLVPIVSQANQAKEKWMKGWYDSCDDGRCVTLRR